MIYRQVKLVWWSLKIALNVLRKSYILPHFDYCSPLLIGISHTSLDKLENTSYYVLRTLCNLPKSISYEQIDLVGLNLFLQCLVKRRPL